MDHPVYLKDTALSNTSDVGICTVTNLLVFDDGSCALKKMTQLLPCHHSAVFRNDEGLKPISEQKAWRPPERANDRKPYTSTLTPKRKSLILLLALN